jgi:acyl-CoA synthetase (AMP-forming)/AMP-acid ligase II
MGRAGDRIGGVFMIPVNDVESELLKHPGVADVALVGYSDGQGGELACAVIVPAAPELTIWARPSQIAQRCGPGAGCRYRSSPADVAAAVSFRRSGSAFVALLDVP